MRLHAPSFASSPIPKRAGEEERKLDAMLPSNLPPSCAQGEAIWFCKAFSQEKMVSLP